MTDEATIIRLSKNGTITRNEVDLRYDACVIYYLYEADAVIGNACCLLFDACDDATMPNEEQGSRTPESAWLILIVNKKLKERNWNAR